MRGFDSLRGLHLSEMPTNQKLIIIDGNALVHRAFHALPPLQTKEGTLVNAVYGFLLVFLKVTKDLKPTHVVVTFDRPGATFRHEAYTAYKATREKKPDELYAQIPIIKTVLEAFRVPVVEADGFEADDVIGTLSRLASEKKLPSIIVTGDLDTLQLVNDYTRVYTLRKGLSDTIIYDATAVQERYGLPPESLVEYRGLKGDPSDNIPGVKGIGEKTASTLIQKFGSVAGLYEVLESGKPIKTPLTPRLKELLLSKKDDAFMSRKLSEIVCDVPLKVSLDDFVVHERDVPTIVKLFQELQFKSLLAKVLEGQSGEVSPAADPSEPKVTYKFIENDSDFKKFLALVSKQKEFAVDSETTGLNPFAAELLGLSFSWKATEAFYVLIDGQADRLEALRPILEDAKVKKWGHNIKYDMEVLATAGVALQGVVGDTMIADYLLHPGSRTHDLDTVVFTELGHRMIPITKLIGEKAPQKPMREVPLPELANYSCEDADFTWRLKDKFLVDLNEAKLLPVLNDIDVPLVPVLAAMEQQGIMVDVEILEKAKTVTTKRLKVLEQKIYKSAGEEFNIASPLQLKEVLFEKLALSTEGIARTKTGLSTAAMELEKLKGEHPIIEFIMEYRELAKLLSTYLEALPQLVDPKTHRIHGTFSQTVAATGRLSSSDPNLQNIPVRTEVGAQIRQAFVAPKGMQFVSADYSQIELRVIASLASDKTMMEIFRKGEDIHRATAAAIHGITLEEVTPEIRYSAKEVNFGVIYGMGAWGLSARTGLSPADAKEFIEKYFAAFSGVKEYLEQTKALARSRGFVESLFGRRRYLPEIKSGVAQVRAAAERMAVNMPIQGTAADIMKLAMIRVHNKLPGVSSKSRLILQVHDELVLEVPEAEIEKVAAFLKETMENVTKLKVPIEANVKVGPNWAALKPL